MFRLPIMTNGGSSFLFGVTLGVYTLKGEDDSPWKTYASDGYIAISYSVWFSLQFSTDI